MRILFVDDEPAVLDGLRRNLRRHRTEWEMSFHGSALDLMEQLTDSRGAVVVTDWQMPEVDGIELCSRLRKRESDDSSCRFYIILLTGVQDVEAAVTALEGGADEFIRKPFDSRELLARMRVGKRILAAEETLRETNRKLAELASTDVLTGLLNRRKVDEVLSAEISRVARSHQSLGVLLFDIDHFKLVNDRYGHAAGDEILRITSARLKSMIRPSGSLARWGGEEFLLLCPKVEPENLEILADRLRRSVCDNLVVLGQSQQIEVAVSIGAAHLRAGSLDSGESLIQRADEGLYAAKDAGRNCVRIWKSSK